MKSIDVYNPGRDLTAAATAPVTAKRFVRITGDRNSDGNLVVDHATAGGRVAGVAAADAAAGALVPIARGKDRVVKVTAGAAIAAFAEVEVGTDGKVITADTGNVVGYAVTAAAPNADAHISLA
ncbi:capsid cement protein [Rhodococcus sp. MSC1_016]|uniref:capsid cement protein n=1 Tax=Rhodococcus sp. MSC1_016 TaxID=2909266 RepID=UPI00203016E8|nr:capsid cement protein [Rhodococcus sp. MSC1_016]